MSTSYPTLQYGHSEEIGLLRKRCISLPARRLHRGPPTLTATTIFPESVDQNGRSRSAGHHHSRAIRR